MIKKLESYKEVLEIAAEVSKEELLEVTRDLAKNDLFFLLTFMCDRDDIKHPWLFERCKEVQANPDGRIDLWAREHYKSSIITFGKTIQDIINNPNITIGIFSFKFNAASDFLKQIRNELKRPTWISTFPEIFYEKPETQAPSWSERAIVVKRSTNKREATVEANGFIDALPTGKHYDVLVFDDIATEKSVTTEDQIRKTQEAFTLSLSLGSIDGARRIIGTFYHYDDIYSTVIEKELAIPRIYPMIDEKDEPVFFSREYALQKKIENTSYVFSCQYLLDPKAESHKAFDFEWLKYYNGKNLNRLNKYIFVDPASSKGKRSDYTAMMVVGIGEDGKYRIIDIIRDKLSLTERCRALIDLHREYKPLKVFYEEYGHSSDIEHIKHTMDKEMYVFNITRLGGKIKKPDRISKLEPLFRANSIFLIEKCIKVSVKGEVTDLSKEFVSEYLKYPFGAHDDMLDALSRIKDKDVHMVIPSFKPKRRYSRAHTNYNWRYV